MKTTWAGIFIIFALLAVAGCGDGGGASKDAFVDGTAEEPGVNPFFIPGDEGTDGTDDAVTEDNNTKTETTNLPSDNDELSCAPAYGKSQLTDGYVEEEYKGVIAISGGSMKYSISEEKLPEGLTLKKLTYVRQSKKSKYYLLSGAPAEAWKTKIKFHIQDTETGKDKTCKLALNIHKQISLKHAVVSPGKDGEENTWDDVHAFTIEDDEDGAEYYKAMGFAWDGNPGKKDVPKKCFTSTKPDKNFAFDVCPTTNDMSIPFKQKKVGYFWFRESAKEPGVMNVTFSAKKKGVPFVATVKVPIAFPGTQQTAPNPSQESTPETGGAENGKQLPQEKIDDIKVLIWTGAVDTPWYDGDLKDYALNNSWFSLLFFTKSTTSLKPTSDEIEGSATYDLEKTLNAADGKAYYPSSACNNNPSNTTNGYACNGVEKNGSGALAAYDDDACFENPTEVKSSSSADVTKIKEIAILWHSDDSAFKFDIRAIVFYTNHRFAIYIDESPWGDAVFPGMCDGWLMYSELWRYDALTSLSGMQKAPDGSIWHERTNPYNNPKVDPAIKKFIDDINNEISKQSAEEGQEDE